MASETGKRRWRRWAIGTVALVAVAAALLVTVAKRSLGDSPVLSMPTFTVARGPLTIDVTEAGTIQAQDEVVLKSKVRGRVTILSLIPEGTHVEKGDLLVELDASAFQDNKVDQQIDVQNAEAAFISARENAEITKSQGESDVAEAELAYRFAQKDLEKYVKGQYPRDLMAAEQQIKLTDEQLQRAKETLKWSQKLYDQKYISQTELEGDKLAANQAQLAYQLAKTDRDLLEQYTNARQLAQLKSDVTQTEAALERAQHKATADNIQAQANLRAKQSQLVREKAKLAKVEEQIRNCKIYAPRAGMVIYGTTGKGGWRGNKEPLAEGQEVREREELIDLPTANAMMAQIKVHEASVDKIELSMPVLVTVDALPGKTYRGRVTRIAPLPDAQSVWMNPDLKLFPADIKLMGEHSEIRTGMSCKARIIVARYPDAIYVPIQCIVKVGKQHTAFVVANGKVQPRPVEIGLDNNRMVRIISGLKAGERVLLSPPLTAGVSTDHLPKVASKGAAGQAEASENVDEKGATGGLSASANRPEASTPAGKPPVAPSGEASGTAANAAKVDAADATKAKGGAKHHRTTGHGRGRS